MDFIKFYKRDTNLPKFSAEAEDYWVNKDVQDVMNCVKKTKTKKLSPLMIIIREYSVAVSPHITLKDILQATETLYERYGIECFQISIDRENNYAHMLFSFYDISNDKLIVLNNSQQKQIYTTFALQFKLNNLQKSNEIVRHILVEHYLQDKNVYKHLLQEINHIKMTQYERKIIGETLRYADLVCKGLTK